MTIEITDVLIFKTNVRTEFDHFRIKNVLDASHKVLKWTLDRTDIDCVLRVVSDSLTAAQIIAILDYVGYECTELE